MSEGHTYHLLVHSQLRPRKIPIGLPAHGSAWAPSPLPPGLSLPCPLRVTRSSRLGWAVHSVLRKPPCYQVEKERGTDWASLMWHSGQHSPTDLVTLDESGWGSKDVQHFLVLISFQQCSQENHTKQLSTNCKGCLFTSPSQFPGLMKAGPAQNMELTWAITHKPLGLMRAGHALDMELTWAITHHHPGLTRAGSSQDMELT